MDVIQKLLENFLGYSDEIDLVEYKKTILNEKLEIFFSYEDNYMRNQKYIYESLITSHISEFFTINIYIGKILENIHYVVNCENMWNEIKQIESEIKKREPLYKNEIMNRKKPIYDISFTLCMLYFGLFLIMYQISIYYWYLISKFTHDSLFNIRDIPIYLGIRLFVVLFVLAYSFFMYYIGIFRILYFIYNIIVNYLLYYTFYLLFQVFKLCLIIIVWIIKILYLIFIMLPRLIFYVIYFIFKLISSILTLFNKINSIEDFKLVFNEIKRDAAEGAPGFIGITDLDFIDNIFDIDNIYIGSYLINTGFKTLTYSVKMILGGLLNTLFFIGDTSENVIDSSFRHSIAGCDRNVILDKVIELSKEKEKKSLKECILN